MTERTFEYRPSAHDLASAVVARLDRMIPTLAERDAADAEVLAAWEQWTEARSFDEHTAAATRLDAAMVALREVAT